MPPDCPRRGRTVRRVPAPAPGNRAGRSDAPQVPHPLQRLEHPQHPGDAALGGDLVDDVRLGHSQLRLGRLQVIEHHRHRAVFFVHRLHRHPGKGIRPGGDVGLRLHRFHRLLYRRRVRLFLFHRRRAAPCRRQQHHRRQKDRPQPLFHPVAAFLFRYLHDTSGHREASRQESDGVRRHISR